ncbi:MAG: ABC transporter permease, partial [Clostridia bacterium]|nr:ABC transporter permease [Clostridia bacterium]
MKNTLKQVFHSPKFVVGFVIFGLILLTMLIYPMINPGNPLEMIGVGTFAKPGTYVSVYDTVGSKTETFRLPEAEANRIAKKLTDADRVSMVEWFTKAGIDVSGLDITDTDTLLSMWSTHFEDKKLPGMTNAVRRNYRLLDTRIKELQAGETLYIADMNEETKLLEEKSTIGKNDYVNLKEIANVKVLPLGTDNFGRDVLKELVSACGTSILIGLIAGAVATLIGLTFGLLAGYLGGIYDDIIMFVTNVFTVIPGFILLILISYSIGQDQRGATVVALVIGLTSWTWTARSVRSQVISLRNRDHVNLSKLSGHSLLRIILTDILPYIASYVVMAFILQVSSGILSEAQLSLLGLGPKTTEVPTLGLMMNWAMLYSAHTNGTWWAYFPVIITITLISFSLNLMNTGL